MEAIGHIRERAGAHGLVTGIHCGGPQYAIEMVEQGFDLVTVGSDARFVLGGAAATVGAMRETSRLAR